MSRRGSSVLAAIGLILAMSVGVETASAANSVKISGRAFIFNHMSTGVSNATIKVREFPRLETTTNELGDYQLRVPDNANVTPYILSGEGLLTQRDIDGEPYGQMQAHWNEIDLQTFHTRGKNLENVNFQAPRDAEYLGLKALLGVPSREDGRPEQCAIVTTASARNVRDVDFRTYWVNTPHGIEGAKARAIPALPDPVYFNHQVIPDPSQPHTSNDGGIIWPIVPTGTYRIITRSPDARFASFLATCRPGRIVNANPPWGAYELRPGERPEGAGNVAAKLRSVRATRAGKRRRLVRVVLRSGERVKAIVRLRAGNRRARRVISLPPGIRRLRFAIGPRIRARRVAVGVRLVDRSRVSFATIRKLRLPRVPRAATRPGRHR